MSGTRVFLFAGGGTGGHIYPALAIAEELKARAGDSVRIIVLCSDRAIDAQILRQEKTNYRAIPARPLSARPKALIKFAVSWGAAIRAARQAIAQAQRLGDGTPRVELVAMGGFVAAPCAQAAQVSGVPVTMINMDAVPGKANRWIARRAQRVITSAAVVGRAAERASGWTLVPPIVRAAARPPGDAATCRTQLGLDPATRTLLVTGASQGARSINRLLVRLIADQRKAFDGWQVVHQSGAGDDEATKAAYDAAGIRAVVKPFFDPMGVCWGAADLAISRAGAGSVAEAWASHTPTVFLPYPYHRDQHQRFNAMPLEQAGGAITCTDHIDEVINQTRERGPGRSLLELMADAPRRDAMRRALQKLGPADGAAKIAAILLTP